MLKIFLIFGLFLISIAGFTQVSDVKVVRIANTSTTFGVNHPDGTIILDVATEKLYQLLLPVLSTASLSTLAINTDYRDYFSDIAYNATSWNGNMDAATKNAIRDKLETVVEGLWTDGGTYVYPTNGETIQVGVSGGTSGLVRWIASDNDQANISITTSDEMTFNNAGGGYKYDGSIIMTNDKSLVWLSELSITGKSSVNYWSSLDKTFFDQAADISTGDIWEFSTFESLYSMNASSGTQSFVAIRPMVEQTSTAAYKALEVNVDENTTGSGTKLLMDLMVNSVSKFSITNAGNANIVGTLDLDGVAAGGSPSTDSILVKTSTGLVKCIDEGRLSGGAPSAHASTHITAGSDEIDGDKLDIDWSPTNYTPATTPLEASSVDNLTAHLYGIDNAFLTAVGADASPELGANLNLNERGFTEELKAGENLVAGDLCCLKSDGKMWKADADAKATSIMLCAIATETINADVTGAFFLYGKYSTSGLTAGVTYYISCSAGRWTLTAPTGANDVVRIVGYALSTTVLFFQTGTYYYEIP